MKKVVINLLRLSIFFLYIILANDVSADEYFKVNLRSVYTFDETGISEVTDSFSIENKVTEKHLPSFEYLIKNVSPLDLIVIQNGKEIKYTSESSENSTRIKINFEDKVLGKGSLREFEIKYRLDKSASRTGDVWEISIPIIENIGDYDDVQIKLFVPESYGEEAYLSPNEALKNRSSGYYSYLFNKESLLTSKIVAGFGEYQIFNFSINYHLENKSTLNKSELISIPPDTSYQRVFYDNINPKPKDIKIDPDGNWLAEFEISPNSQMDVLISGNVQIFAYPRHHLIPETKNLYENVKPSKYWQSDSDKIISIVNNISTPKDMYEYVTNTLKYDYSLERKERMGALPALESINPVTCREYSDLLITLFRAKGIPAREVVGYAYTDNLDLKPVTFFNDILHSWVEYWDFEKNVWVSVDPTWGATSKSDYFSKLDLRHFAFSIHGTDDSTPLPPGFFSRNGYKKDIFINFGKLDSSPEKQFLVESNFGNLFLFSRKTNITIKNNNKYALYNKNIKYYVSGKLIYEDNLKAIPPLSTESKSIKSPFSLLGSNTPDKYQIVINSVTYLVDGPKKNDMYSQIITISVLILLVFFIFTYRYFKKHAKK